MQAAGLSWSAANAVAQAFFNQGFGDMVLASAVSGHYPLKKENDAKIAGTDCYVVSGVMDLSQLSDLGKPGTADTTLWIGKQDFLIRQSRMKYVEEVGDFDQAVDETIKMSLEKQHKPVTPEALEAMRPQMRVTMSMIKSGFAAGLVFTQTHKNIVVNQSLSPADFAR